jgi:hypothetical protein
MPGNTGIQLCVAYHLYKKFGFTSLKIRDVNKDKLPTNTYAILNDDSWEAFGAYTDIHAIPRLEDFKSLDAIIAGYFHISDNLFPLRDTFRSNILTDSVLCVPISLSGTTLYDFYTAAPPIKLLSTDIVMHIRLGDFRKANCVIDPVPQLQILREVRRKEPDTRIIIVCQAPTTDTERSYIRLFEEFHPIIQSGTELEDFATLRSAKRILVTNSTFSWFAAFLGDATERWIPTPRLNELKNISETDIIYTAEHGFVMSQLDIPTQPFLPVTGEFLQSLCDYTVINVQKKKEMHDWINIAAPIDRQLMTQWIDIATPLERQLFTEVEWPANVIATAKSLFVYPDTDLLKALIDRGPWPALRLIVCHNGDDPVNYELLLPFLDANPTLYAWIQNNVVSHPRIRSIPIAESNRMWREGTAELDPPITVCRSSSRDYGILYPWCSDTHHSRRMWFEQARGLRAWRPDMHLFTLPHPKEDYIEALESAHAVVCPRGNGLDTHRHWEVLYKGAWAIVPANAHTVCMLLEYPSLPFIPIESPIEIPSLELPVMSPSPFHPMLLRPFWQIMYKSYLL